MGLRDTGTRAAITALVGTLENVRLREALTMALNGDKPKDQDKLRQEILSGKEAARVLGVTDRCVRNWATEGLLRRVALPGRVRAFGYSRESVEALVEGRGVTA